MSIVSVTIRLDESRTEFTIYPGANRVQMILKTDTGYQIRENTITMEQFIEVLQRVIDEKKDGD